MKLLFLLAAFFLMIPFFSCNKYLDEKSSQSLTVPTQVADLWAILDISEVSLCPGSGDMLADDYYLPDAIYNALPLVTYQNLYRWDKDVFNDNYPNDYVVAYKTVYKANLVLDNVSKVATPDSSGRKSLNEVRGSALFLRGKSFWDIAQVWGRSYNKVTQDQDLGIPLRLSSDFNIVSTRATVRDTYNRIIEDLKTAASLLPEVPVHVVRPCKYAAWGMLARVYLSLGEYSEAKVYADSFLSVKNVLLDLNGLNSSATYPFQRFNKEVIFSCYESGTPLSNARVDSNLYQSYTDNDLRKTMYFSAYTQSVGGGYRFRGSYYASSQPFTGIAVDEQYIIKAECEARLGDKVSALQTLNSLLITRYKHGDYEPYTVSGVTNLLDLVLQERRKELFFRSIRWSDLRRFNLEDRDITLKRTINGVQYLLPPNDGRYAINYPVSVIKESGIQQNN